MLDKSYKLIAGSTACKEGTEECTGVGVGREGKTGTLGRMGTQQSPPNLDYLPLPPFLGSSFLLKHSGWGVHLES